MALTDSGGLVPTMPVQPANNYSGGVGMWGQDWIWIIVLFLFGWGRNGFGNGSGVTDGYVLASDFSNIERKIDGVNSGVCDGFYAMNTGMLNGFAGVTQAVTNGFSQAERTAAARTALQLHRCATTWRHRLATPEIPLLRRPATSLTIKTRTPARSSIS